MCTTKNIFIAFLLKLASLKFYISCEKDFLQSAAAASLWHSEQYLDKYYAPSAETRM